MLKLNVLRQLFDLQTPIGPGLNGAMVRRNNIGNIAISKNLLIADNLRFAMTEVIP